MVKLVLAQEETITIASAKFVVNPTIYIFNGTTIAPGSAAVSIDGHLVSADSANNLFVDGTEILTRYHAASLTSNVVSANNTAFEPSVFSDVHNSDSSRSASPGSQSKGGPYGLMSASTLMVALNPTTSATGAMCLCQQCLLPQPHLSAVILFLH